MRKGELDLAKNKVDIGKVEFGKEIVLVIDYLTSLDWEKSKR